MEKLITSKKKGMPEFLCNVSDCSEFQDIERLLRNAPAARRPSLETFLAANFDDMKSTLAAMRNDAKCQFQELGTNIQLILSQAEDHYTRLMQALTDEAKEGPRLFSFQPMDRRLFDKPKWISAKFRLTLWCEHSRLPLPALNGKDDPRGIYELDLPREWVVKSLPYVKILSRLLSLVVPVAAAGTKFELDEATYKGIEKQLEFGQKSLESALKGSEKAEDWASEDNAPHPRRRQRHTCARPRIAAASCVAEGKGPKLWRPREGAEPAAGISVGAPAI